MQAEKSIDIQEIIDRAPVSVMQKKALVICLAFGIVDGFDSLIIGFVVPAIARDWGVTAASLTPVNLAAVIGTIFGAVLLAPLADRVGRRPIIFAGTLVFGLLTLGAAAAPGVEFLVVLRFLAGLGLGAVPATLIAYGTETAPARLRGTFVTVIGVGLAAGGFFGGFAAGLLIPAAGWRSVFVLGGVIPLLLLVPALKLLPETIQFSAVSGRRAAVVHGIAKIDSAVVIDPDASLVLHRSATPGSRFRALFENARGPMTIILWVLYLCQFIGSFFIFSWLPSILTNAGLRETTALFATSACTLGGMIGGILLGVAVDRVAGRFRLLVTTYVVGASAVVVSAVATGTLPVLFVALFVAGLGVIGTGVCMNAVAAGLYPSSMRTTAIGWFNGFGRVGSVLGPALGGILLGLSLSSQSIFLLSAAPVVVCAICVALLSVLASRVVGDRPRP